jgi:hypothetical protein
MLAIIAVAIVAAAISHVAIDWLGDVLLAHDTYDDVRHESRTVTAALAAAAWLVAATASLHAKLTSALGRRAASRVFVQSPRRLCALVVPLAITLVIAMELVDTLLARRPVAGLDELLGGSIALGLSTSSTVAFAIAITAGALLRFFLCTERLLVHAVWGLFQSRERRAISAFLAIARRHARVFVRLVVRRHAAKRGPPSILIARPN